MGSTEDYYKLRGVIACLYADETDQEEKEKYMRERVEVLEKVRGEIRSNAELEEVSFEAMEVHL